MYYERGVIPTFNFIQDLETTYKKQSCIDDYNRGYLDGCVKAFNNCNKS